MRWANTNTMGKSDLSVWSIASMCNMLMCNEDRIWIAERSQAINDMISALVSPLRFMYRFHRLTMVGLLVPWFAIAPIYQSQINTENSRIRIMNVRKMNDSK